MLHDILVINIHRDVDQSGLERLRTQLSLRKFGRLTDDGDQQFGYRKIEQASGQYAEIFFTASSTGRGKSRRSAPSKSISGLTRSK
ncbi:hypothetical protein [Mycolicibacterium baixiangningiae]|uniref:hypothetical protein n=1 Tax=Mycolicibacterium baixiangningiae TaxID=2761578 RepID=UPI0018683D68|nr:hypothetical protein [Mycolicibacterium baixiangningiae]